MLNKKQPRQFRKFFAPAKKGLVLLAFLFLWAQFGITVTPVQAKKDISSTNAEGRTEERRITVVTRHWQLATWSSGELVCDLYLRHDNFPSFSDVRKSCGDSLMVQWITTPACEGATSGKTADCEGVLLRYLGKIPVTYTEVVELPGINISLIPFNCAPGEWCVNRPVLQVQAIEPLSNFHIKNVYIRMGNRNKTYTGGNAVFNLPLTDEQGSWIEYWADSSYGDQSERVRIRYRSRVSDDGANFHFDLLDSEWKNTLPSGTLLWQIFPPSEGLAAVLEQPTSPVQLYTTDSYLYLAGYLIQSGQVDASSCSDGGLYLEGSASPCGEKMAEAQVIDWQNRYNAQILQAALKYNIPAMLLKNVIAQESQFINETNKPYEKGLGHMTSEGVDMILIWNTDYYLENCLEIFEEYQCSPGYASLDETRQALLRKYILDKIGTPAEIEVLAAAIFATAAQSGQMVKNISGVKPMYNSSYIDMWKISAGNYYGGAGCMSAAIQEVFDEGNDILWNAITPHLTEDCALVEDYVEKVIAD